MSEEKKPPAPPGVVKFAVPGCGGEAVDHPAHYGGKDDPYEAIKVIEAWGLGFNLGNAVKYVCRAGKKAPHAAVADLAALEDLKKAAWYLAREISNREQRNG